MLQRGGEGAAIRLGLKQNFKAGGNGVWNKTATTKKGEEDAGCAGCSEHAGVSPALKFPRGWPGMLAGVESRVGASLLCVVLMLGNELGCAWYPGVLHAVGPHPVATDSPCVATACQEQGFAVPALKFLCARGRDAARTPRCAVARVVASAPTSTEED